MSSPPLNQALFDTAANVFESLAMMFLVTDEEAVSCVDEPVRVAVRFAQMDACDLPLCGTLRAEVCPKLLDALAANMLGLPSAGEIPATQKEDALKELANVVCGNLLPAIAGRQAVFHIEAPQMGGDAGGAGTPVATALLKLDAGCAALAFLVDNQAAVPNGAAETIA